MSSKARKIKTLSPPENGQGYFHREHRSRKGRGYHPEIVFTRDRKRKMEQIIIEEIEKEYA